MRFAAIYGAGAAMGFPPDVIDRMSMWQFFAAMDGWVTAKGGGENPTLSQAEKDDIWEWMQTKESAPLTNKTAAN